MNSDHSSPKIHRRAFLGASAKTGAVAMLTGTLPFSDALASTNEKETVSHSAPAEIKNQYFRVHFDTQTGRLQIWNNDGSEFLVNSIVRVIAPSWFTSSADEGFSRNASTNNISDTIGQGQKIVAECTNKTKALIIGVEITIYNELKAVVVEAFCKNASSQNQLMIRSVEPIHALHAQKGKLAWRHGDKILTNGYMHYDPGNILDMGWSHEHSFSSMWNMGFSGGNDQTGLVAGYLDNKTSNGFISAIATWDGIGLVAESRYNTEFVINPGKSVSSGKFTLLMGHNPFEALESFAATMGILSKVKLNPIINGWCSWFYTHHTHINEQEVLKNAKYAAKQLKPYGLEWIQIDEGYSRGYGDWDGNERFPHGMKWLAERIREYGLRPGIWIGPYLISHDTDVHKNHPDWLIRNLDGTIRVCGDRDGRPFYGLDISIPEAAEWFRSLIKTVARDWGYDFIKIDFVEWTILSAERYNDASWSKAMAYRKGMEIIREAMGPDKHLLDCGPAQFSAGLVDSMRIERDTSYLSWQQYTDGFNSNGPACGKRYYFHNRTWINDADHLGLMPLSPAQACVAASIIALSGGTVVLGDRLYEFDPARLKIAQQVLPAFGKAARPIDLFEREKAQIFSLPVKTDFGQWTVVGLYNFAHGTSVERTISVKALGLDPEKKYLAFEFWTQQPLPAVHEELRLTISSETVALVLLKEELYVPQVLSTDRHYTQGGIELTGVKWDNITKTLSGTSLGPAESHHTVWVHIPAKFAWDTPYEPQLPKDADGFSVRLWANGLLRLHIDFGNNNKIAWNIKFREV